MRKIFLFLLLLAAGFTIYYFKFAQSFSLQEIPLSAPFHPEWEMSLEEDAEAVFSQPFSYLGRGHQCIAFESQDHRYVLKFPHLKKVSQKKRMKDARRYLLAFEQLREETGLIYLHLNRTASLNRKVLLTDMKGRKLTIDLDRIEFVVQKKAELLYPAIERWMHLGQIEKAKQGLSSLIDLFKKRSAQGIDDSEQHLEGNFGFLENRAVQIDFGHIKQGEPNLERIWRLLSPLKEQLDSDFPELGDYLELQKNQKLS